MKCENVICYKKDNKIYSIGVNINNRIANMLECLINREHSKLIYFIIIWYSITPSND